MADPTLQTFCCHHRREVDTAYHLMNVFQHEDYLITSIVSSSLGILGSVYQIFIRRNGQDFNTTRSVQGRRIILYLAISDLLASLGVFIRSILWSFMKPAMPYADDSSVLFCAISSAFVQTFYTATWMWTFIYAFNMKKALKNEPVRERDLHVFVWSLSILLTSIGTTTLYYPNADCHIIDDIMIALIRVMPNYFFNYGPIIFVMIINPIIYVKCSREVDRQLVQRYGQYTNNERQIHDLFKIKFSLINIIFYICWLPNIVNAILMWTMWSQLSRTNMIGYIVEINWYIIAALNPLQAFFNAFVYRKWNEGICNCGSLRKWFTAKFRRREDISYTTQVLSETSPLLRGAPYSQLRSEPDAEPENFHRYSIQCNVI